MINLLPPEVKQEYIYALRNTVLRRWIIACVLGLIGLGFVATYGLATIQRSTDSYSTIVTSKQNSLNQQKLGPTEAQVKDITGNLKLVLKVLSKEVLFSQVLKQMAAVIPPNAILTNLQISQTTGALDITAKATDYATASQVQANLQDPANKLFSKADLIGIHCGGTTNDPYPCTVQIRALFASNNPFLFINTNNKVSKP